MLQPNCFCEPSILTSVCDSNEVCRCVHPGGQAGVTLFLGDAAGPGRCCHGPATVALLVMSELCRQKLCRGVRPLPVKKVASNNCYLRGLQ